MGSFHGTEICDLVGLYLLDKINIKTGLNKMGLYRDDDLGVIDQTSETHRDRLKKKTIKAFKDIGYKITIEIGLPSTEFFDVSFNFLTDYYQVYSKPVIFVNKNSSYLPYENNYPKSLKTDLLITQK